MTTNPLLSIGMTNKPITKGRCIRKECKAKARKGLICNSCFFRFRAVQAKAMEAMSAKEAKDPSLLIKLNDRCSMRVSSDAPLDEIARFLEESLQEQ